MKKVILSSLTLLSIATGFSQEKEEKKGWFYRGEKVNATAGLTIQATNTVKIGAFVDQHYFNEKTQKYSVLGMQGAIISMTGTNSNNNEITGTGTEVFFTKKSYFSKNKNHGFYSGGGIVVGNVEFEQSIYNGKYRYFSFFAPEIGYDFLIAKKVRDRKSVV